MIPIGFKTGKKILLTPTSINTFIRCPRRYYYNKIARLRQPPNIHLIRGDIVHKTIEEFYRYKINQCKGYDFTDLKLVAYNLLKHQWKRRRKTFQSLELTEADQEFFFQESLKMLFNFIESFYFNRGFDKPSPIIEKKLYSKSLRLHGRIDAIYKNDSSRPPLIVDFKTNKSREVTLDIARQLGIYALLYHEHYDVFPEVGVHFLNFKNGLQKLDISPVFLEFIKSLVSDIHNRTKSDNISDYPCVCDKCDKLYQKTA